MEKGALLLAPADPIVEDYLPAEQKVVRFGPGAELEITELTERKDSLTFKAKFLWSKPLICQ